MFEAEKNVSINSHYYISCFTKNSFEKTEKISVQTLSDEISKYFLIWIAAKCLLVDLLRYIKKVWNNYKISFTEII